MAEETTQETPKPKAEAPPVVEDWKKKAVEYLDLAQRTRAEFENYQKRARDEREREWKYAYTPLVRDLLPVIDNLERALAAAKETGPEATLAQGVAMVQAQFVDLLKRNHIVRIEAVGKPFDPNAHQAVMQQPSADQPPDTVLQVLEQGYMIHDRVLRPAKVIVSGKV